MILANGPRPFNKIYALGVPVDFGTGQMLS
jgi:hypothetical protein